ncbi:HlyD family type I secretion periplasmic adaptor subunit [Roseovarius salinarum]|uniref:HlyD family type I secretion periplasmic adaptor subunit n=1 Tax=Roseovarius salinarum TaxID=1981892 RepID=UPI000C33F56A|nr:HlyD family type I secretion periplasmic adaptor subunit [Roseovarius salinarum]
MTSSGTPFSPRRPILLGVIGLVLLVGGFGTWAVATTIAGAVIAPGRIEVDRNRQVIQHPDGGIVEEILVAEGDTVAAGDVLIRLDDSEAASQLAIVENQLFELIARRGRLEAERDGKDMITFDPLLEKAARDTPAVRELMAGQRRLMRARADSVAQEVDQLRKRRSQIANQIDGIEAQRTALQRQLELIAEELADQQSLLDRGLAQAARVLALQREEAGLRGRIGELKAQKAQARGRMTEIDIEIVKLRSTRREEAIARLRDLQSRERDLREERRALKQRIARLDITAPVSGIVHGLKVFAPRAVIRAAEPLLSIVPQDRPLVINARVDPVDIDQIHPGQPVTLRFSALDQRRAPELTGHIVRVSPDAFRDDRTGQSYYSARITLGPDARARLPEGTALVPGMPVETYIRTVDRTPLAYLVRPLTDYFTRAFRG